MSAILAAVNSPALSSLRTTRRSLDKEAVKILNSLNATLDSTRDYHEYTRLLQGRSSKKDEPCIPWLGKLETIQSLGWPTEIIASPSRQSSQADIRQPKQPRYGGRATSD